MKTIRWGIIGCGEVAQQKSGPALYKAANSALVAVADRNAARAETFAREHGVARWHGDAEPIIAASDIDIVYVATMTESHHDLVMRCAAAGKPVLTEKPMAMSHADCLAMIDACGEANVPLWVAYYRRALPRFLKVRDLVRDGALGRRHFRRGRWPHAGHPRFHSRADRVRARVRRQSGRRVYARRRRDRRVPIRVGRPWKRRMVLFRRL